MASVNKVIIVGALGRDPESRSMANGGKVVNFSVATSESWTDKDSGERKEKTQWHRIVVWNERLGDVALKYLTKGSRVYLEGALESRKYTGQDGIEKETTEVVLARYRGELVMLSNKSDAAPAATAKPAAKPAMADLDDEIPF